MAEGDRDADTLRSPDSALTGEKPRTPSRATLAVGAVLAVLVGVLLGVQTAAWLDADFTAPPAADSVEVGFAQDMSTHHGQAVEMSSMALTNADDPAIRTLAYDVITTQQSQLGNMQGWLALWGQPSTGSRPLMAWMSSDMPGGMQHSGSMSPGRPSGSSMPGMATAAELAELRTLTGPAFDVRYLQLLLRHHQGGIPMAQYAANSSGVTTVRTLATQIANTQQAESLTIEQLLQAKGAVPLSMN
ncbi:DUF305 domain-containing protein [Rhodococcus sp. SGAir0479]|uniref:DUF305 domain-containing protein n=1 Tax=Rhodococcus sp. SGAir0479 TaxID=2567884 RepID=UPI0010CD603F|nr:DUF305 domain-containing protein [Rhodococcus sp. SGAir0479]QCQ94114.1 DUF305 domain-containing protein [Rhodococcus sp. SGAir0479]